MRKQTGWVTVGRRYCPVEEEKSRRDSQSLQLIALSNSYDKIYVH